MAKKRTLFNTHLYEDQKIVRDITDFLKNEYKQYAKYVIATRAIPSIVDGFKVGARKIMWGAFNGGAKNGKEIKNLNLVGDVLNLTLYNHGDASLHGTIFTLSQFFKDNLNPLSINGQCGSLRDENAISAPRYLHVKLSKYAKLYKTDIDLIEQVFDEGMYLEPVNFFPIIPTVLTSRAEGMAPGYKFQSFSYNPLDVIDACIDVVGTGHTSRMIRPYVRGIKQSNFIKDEESGRWFNYGEYTVDESADTVYITDLPYNIGFDDFEKQLNKLVDSGYIKDWSNHSEDSNINYWVFFPKCRLSRELQQDRFGRFIKNLCLKAIVPDDILTVLDEHQKIKVFGTPQELIEYFVNYRLTIYKQRKEKLVEVMNKKLIDNKNICKFIQLVNEGKIIVTNRKKSDVKKDLDKYELPYSVLQIAISRLTDEERKELELKNEEITKELEYIKKTSIEQMYFNDLISLHQELQDDFQ